MKSCSLADEENTLKGVPQINSLSEAVVTHQGHMMSCDFLEAVVQGFSVHSHKPKTYSVC